MGIAADRSSPCAMLFFYCSAVFGRALREEVTVGEILAPVKARKSLPLASAQLLEHLAGT